MRRRRDDRHPEGWTTEEVDAAWVEEVDEGWAEWEGDYEYVRQGRSRLKLAVTFLFAILLVGLLVVGGLSLWVVRQINPPGDPGAKLTVTIDPERPRPRSLICSRPVA